MDRPAPGRLWRAVRLSGGVVLGAAAAYAAAFMVDWTAVASASHQARPRWVAAALISVLVTVSLVTLRWRMLLGPADGETRWRVMWNSIVVGQAVNILFPLRMGEAARVAVVNRDGRRPLGAVVVAIAVERVFDLIAFALMLTVLAAGGMAPIPLTRGPGTMLGLAVALAAGILAARWWRPSLFSGFRFTSPAKSVALAGLTLVILITSASTNALVFKAFDLAVRLPAAFVVLAALQLGTSVVSVPGNVGVFHWIVVAALGWFAVPPAEALAVAIVLHLVSLGPRVLAGVVAILTDRGRGAPAAPAGESGR